MRPDSAVLQSSHHATVGVATAAPNSSAFSRRGGTGAVGGEGGAVGDSDGLLRVERATNVQRRFAAPPSPSINGWEAR